MANQPIDSTRPNASKNIALAPNRTNLAPTPNKSVSPPSKEEKEKLNRPSKKATATLPPPLGQFFINIILQIAAFAAAVAFGVFAVKSINIARTANEYSASANSYAAQALEEARVANQVAMLAVCSQPGATQNSGFADFCFRVLNGAPIVMPDAASNLFSKLSTAITTSSVSTSIVRGNDFTSSITFMRNFVTSTAYSERTLSTQSTQYPVSSSSNIGDNRKGDNRKGDNRKISLAIAFPISFLFLVIIIATSIIRSKRKSKRLNAGQGLIEEEHDEVQGHGHPPRNKLFKQWKERGFVGNWRKTFRAYFLDSTVSTNQE